MSLRPLKTQRRFGRSITLAAIIAAALLGSSVAASSDAQAASRHRHTRSGVTAADVREFQTFWTGFRQAALYGTAEQVMDHAKFQFRKKQHAGQYPGDEVGRREFKVLLKDTLECRASYNPKSENLARYLERKTKVTARDLTSANFTRLADFEFTRTDLGWKLTAIHEPDRC